METKKLRLNEKLIFSLSILEKPIIQSLFISRGLFIATSFIIKFFYFKDEAFELIFYFSIVIDLASFYLSSLDVKEFVKTYSMLRLKSLSRTLYNTITFVDYLIVKSFLLILLLGNFTFLIVKLVNT